MERYEDVLDTVELGVATEETRGGIVRSVEPGGKLPFLDGIADDD